MRSHIVERMEEVFGEDATEQIVNCLPEEDQHDFRMLENTGNPVAISAFVRVSDFPRIVNAHKETFPFNNRTAIAHPDAVRIRNDFAHPAGKSFQQERVERQLRLLTGLIRKIDPAADGAAQEWERRLLMADENASHGLTADRESAPNSDEPVAELRASLRAAVDEIRAAPAQPDAGAIAQQLSDALTPQLNVLRSRLDETREARAAELREALAAATENMDESRLLLEAARQDRERAQQERGGSPAVQRGSEAAGDLRHAWRASGKSSHPRSAVANPGERPGPERRNVGNPDGHPALPGPICGGAQRQWLEVDDAPRRMVAHAVGGKIAQRAARLCVGPRKEGGIRLDQGRKTSDERERRRRRSRLRAAL